MLKLNGKKCKIDRQDFPHFGETLTLKAKQMDNALRRFASGTPAALAIIERGLSPKVSKKRYAELTKTRVIWLDQPCGASLRVVEGILVQALHGAGVQEC